MTSARIPCINPTCRRTADAAKFNLAEEIVCGKCWKLLPKPMTARYRQVRKRWRVIDRLVAKRQAKSIPFSRDPYAFVRKQCKANWRKIRAYFLNPPAPEGLENFLKENGLG